MVDFINEGLIFETLEETKNTEKEKVLEIIERAKECGGLNLEETAVLLNQEEPEIIEKIFDAANYVKEHIYGKRVVLFAPLYTSNECTNNCLYCGFRRDNKELHRKSLTLEEIVEEAKAIANQGHKRILLVCGEHPQKSNVKFIAEAITSIYKSADIRRINVNIAPMTVEEFRELKRSGIGTYQIFQETYHRETYKKMHPVGKKADYDWRVTAFDRALEAGIDDVGLGVLFGLFDYKFEVLALLSHAQYLDSKFGVGPHTISIPRLRPALGAIIQEAPYPVSDDEFKKLVAIIRLAVPYTGIILSTRERPELRDELLHLGVSQISAGSHTSPGGYKEVEEKADQFEKADHRSLDEVIRCICKSGYLPSFCTACYRSKRTGESFMELAKTGHIHEFCQPNAILTFKENLLDFASPETRRVGEETIEEALKEIEDENIRKLTVEKLKIIEEGKRDVYF